jgi:hypothetical protein
MAEAFAGFICGFALAVIVTPLMTLALVRGSVRGPVIDALAPGATNLVVLSVVLHTLAFVVLTAIGMILGLSLNGFESRRPAGGLGSPNGAFTLLVLAIAAIAVLPLAAVLPRQRVWLVAGGIAFAVTFGWVMPYLSLIGPDAG